MIPNIAHYVFGLQEQTEDFLFCYYLSVYSCSVINSPDRILFHYHHEPKGKWWEETKKLPGFELHRIEIPRFLGPHVISRTAHKADVVRMRALYEHGGVYLDMDTICVREWGHLLQHNTVLAKEKSCSGIQDGICNAIMMTAPRSPFFEEWIAHYPRFFAPQGWREASIILPLLLAEEHPENLTLQEPSVFFEPSWNETDKIFEENEENEEIPESLIALHLWESYSQKYLDTIHDWTWAEKNSNTLYGRIMKSIQERVEVE
jgi:hypothetical protein